MRIWFYATSDLLREHAHPTVSSSSLLLNIVVRVGSTIAVGGRAVVGAISVLWALVAQIGHAVGTVVVTPTGEEEILDCVWSSVLHDVLLVIFLVSTVSSEWVFLRSPRWAATASEVFCVLHGEWGFFESEWRTVRMLWRRFLSNERRVGTRTRHGHTAIRFLRFSPYSFIIQDKKFRFGCGFYSLVFLFPSLYLLVY